MSGPIRYTATGTMEAVISDLGRHVVNHLDTDEKFVRASAYDALQLRVEALEKLLESGVETFDMSQSGYIPGCGEDNKFNSTRDAWVLAARAALKEQQT